MLKRAFVEIVVVAGLAAPLAAQTAVPAPAPAAPSAAATAPQAKDTLTAEQIAAGNVAARGGLEAWRAVRSMRMSGRMDAGKGMQVPFTLQLKRQRKMRLEFLFEGQMVVQAYDGKAGWKRQPYLGKGSYALMTAEELQGAAGQAELDGPLVDYQSKGHKLELLGRETVGGRAAYKLAVTLATGAVRHLYLDAETFLETKVDGSRKLRGKDRKLETFFRDYRPVQGLLVAHTVETKEAGAPKPSAMTIERVELNPELDDALFAPPPG
jgi:hypothetical protein